MATPTKRDSALRSNWKAFLAPIVGRGCPVSVANLADRLNAMKGRVGDNRAELYGYLRETQKPLPEAVFDVGEALRDCGISYSSGPYALYRAGYAADLARYLVALGEPQKGRRPAFALFVLLPLLIEDESATNLIELSNLARAEAGDLFHASWLKRSETRKSWMTHILDALEAFRSDEPTFDTQMAWRLMVEWALYVAMTSPSPSFTDHLKNENDLELGLVALSLRNSSDLRLSEAKSALVKAVSSALSDPSASLEVGSLDPHSYWTNVVTLAKFWSKFRQKSLP